MPEVQRLHICSRGCRCGDRPQTAGDSVSKTISHSPLQDTERPKNTKDKFEVYTVDFLPISDTKLEEFHTATDNDGALQKVKQHVVNGWPAERNQIDPEVSPFWNNRDQISVCDGLLLKADKLVVPTVLRKEMLHRIHSSHLGIDKCRRRARDILYWPGMNAQIADLVEKCSTCQEHRSAQQKEPLMPHEVPNGPWQKLGSDLFELNNKQYVLLVDYYSKFVEFAELRDTKSITVIAWLKSQFARHGIPEILISDNGPQYASSEFVKFAKVYEFTHTTSSPRYPQSNGMAERAVQTTKNVLKKAVQAGEDPYLAVLEWRNTPQQDLGSAAQLLF